MLNLVIDLEKAAYKLQGRMNFQGLNISIENRKGSIRKGVDKDGHEWRTKMKHAYGYIRLSDEVRRKGADGDHVDCFIGPSRGSEKVFVVHMNRADNGKFDEDKVFLGFDSKDDAIAAFKLNYDKVGQKLFGGVTEMDISAFKQRLAIRSKGMIKSLRINGNAVKKTIPVVLLTDVADVHRVEHSIVEKKTGKRAAVLDRNPKDRQPYDNKISDRLLHVLMPGRRSISVPKKQCN